MSAISPSNLNQPYPPFEEINPSLPKENLSPTINQTTEIPSNETSKKVDADTPSEADMREALKQSYKNTAEKISQNVKNFIEKFLDKPTMGVDGNISWPVKSLWGKVTSLRKTEPQPFEEIRNEIQKTIEGKDKTSNWFENSLQDLKNSAEKLKQVQGSATDGDKSALQQAYTDLYRKHKMVELLSNCPLPNNELPLHYAVRLNNLEGMQHLLKMGATPFERDQRGNNVLRKDMQGQTILDYATLNNNPKIKALIIDYFKNLSQSMLEKILENAIEKQITLDEKFFEIAEKTVYEHIDEMLADSAKKGSLGDPLAPTMQQWIHAGLVVSLATTYTLCKVLNNFESTQGGAIVEHVDNMTQVIANLGNLMQIIELSSSFVIFANGFLQNKAPIVPWLSYMGLQVLGAIYSPFAQLNSAIHTTIMASTVIDTSYLCYQNFKQRPFAAATKAIVTSLNLGARYAHIFEAFKPKIENSDAVKNTPKIQKDLTMNMKKLNITGEDKALVWDLVNDPENCTNAFKELAKRWHPDKGGDNNFMALLSEARETFCS